MLAAHQHRSRSWAAINHLLFGDVTRSNPSLAVPIAKKLHSLKRDVVDSLQMSEVYFAKDSDEDD